MGVLIRADLARTEEDRNDIIAGWRRVQDETPKERRQFWIFWAVMFGLGGIIWAFIKHSS
jgi:hypothetical protein